MLKSQIIFSFLGLLVYYFNVMLQEGPNLSYLTLLDCDPRSV